MTHGYLEFRGELERAHDAFEQDHDPAHLRRIAELLEPIAHVIPERARVRWEFSGWSDRRIVVARRTTMQQAPHRTLRVTRTPRPELGRRGRLLRYGFRIEITTRDAVRLRRPATEIHCVMPIFADPRGRTRSLAASNDDVARALTLASPAWDKAPRGTGYLDRIVTTVIPADPSEWLFAFVNAQPERLIRFAGSGHGAPWRALLADSLAVFPLNDRWHDRYRLHIAGAAGPFTSDLQPLQTRWPLPHVTGDVALPVGTVQDHVIRFASSETRLPSPNPEWIGLSDVTVQDGGLVTAGQDLVGYELGADPSSDFVAGYQHTLYGSPARPDSALLRRAPESTDRIHEGILLAGRADENWYHWLVEYLPRVLEIPTTVPQDAPVLVTPRTPGTGIEALRELTQRPVVTIDPSRSTPIDRLWVAAPVAQVIDSTAVPFAEGLAIRQEPLRKLREHWGVATARSGRGRRIFLRRRSRWRNIRNEATLVEIAQRESLEVIDPTGLDFAAQRSLYAETELLVGASGAVMANYLFLRPGSRIIGLTSEHLSDFVLPAVLAEIAECDFSYITGPATVHQADTRHSVEWLHADFTIDPTAFTGALAEKPTV